MEVAMANIFISYRREDAAAHAGRIYDRLAAHFGKNHVFMDVDTIKPGDDFVEVVEKTVAACDLLIVVIGKQWLGAADKNGRRRLDVPEDFVRMEISVALERKIRVIPALVQGAEMPAAADLPPAISALARRNALELSETGFHRGVDDLITTVESLLLVEKSSAPATAQTARSEAIPLNATDSQAPRPAAAGPVMEEPFRILRSVFQAIQDNLFFPFLRKERSAGKAPESRFGGLSRKLQSIFFVFLAIMWLMSGIVEMLDEKNPFPPALGIPMALGGAALLLWLAYRSRRKK
jgi:hypothetical protein